ncbi:hypothetical protein C8R46DRAFT_1069874 [Mycena filopes]|nr:hypothetical protein C8R46DRAFT_1069874 [Mycena filopes]
MAAAALLQTLRGCYLPQFVLGGLTRAVGPVILRHAVSAISTAVNQGEKQASVVKAPSLIVPELDAFDGQCPASTSFNVKLAILSSNSSHPVPSSVKLEMPPTYSNTGIEQVEPAVVFALSASFPLYQDICLLHAPSPSIRIPAPASLDFSSTPIRDLTAVSASFPFLTIQDICLLYPRPRIPGLAVPVSASLDVSQEFGPTLVRSPAVPVSAAFPFLSIQDICLLHPRPSMTGHLAPLPASSNISGPPGSTAASAPLSTAQTYFPPVIQLLALGGVIFLFLVFKLWGRYNRIAPGDLALLPPTPSTLPSNPSDSLNWRARNNRHTETIAVVNPPPNASGQVTEQHTAHLEGALTPRSPKYVPPHKRASFDFGGRRPLADVGNNGRAIANHKLRRRLSTQFPSSQEFSHRLHHRASLPLQDNVRSLWAPKATA